MYWVIEFYTEASNYWDLTDFKLSGSMSTLSGLGGIKHCVQLVII